MTLADEVPETRTQPNQGTRKSLVMALAFELILGLHFGVGFWVSLAK